MSLYDLTSILINLLNRQYFSITRGTDSVSLESGKFSYYFSSKKLAESCIVVKRELYLLKVYSISTRIVSIDILPQEDGDLLF